MTKKKYNFFRAFNGIFGTCAAISSLMNGIIFKSMANIYFFIAYLLISLPFTIELIKEIKDWDYIPKIKRSYIVTIILVVLLFSHGYYLVQESNEDAKQYCLDNNLLEGCTQKDICKRDCEESNLEYSKYESGDIFANPDCWCKGENGGVQVW